MAANLQGCKKTVALIFFSLMYNFALDEAKYNCCKCIYHRYGNATSVDERHRHRYEVVLLNCQIAILNRICHCSLYNDEKCFVFQLNPDMVPDFERAGLQFVGKDESGRRMEVDLEFFPWIL